MKRQTAPAESDYRNATDEQLLARCRWEAFRGSGPGGQKRNKTSSAVRITHLPTRLSATAGESRSQAENRARALRRLRLRLVVELRQPVDLDSFEPPAWYIELGKQTNLRMTRRHPSFLPLAGLVLDVLAAVEWSVSAAARKLNLSTAALVKFLSSDEKLWAEVNRRRAALGLRPLAR